MWKEIFIITLLALVIGGSNGLVYYVVTNDYNQKINVLERDIEDKIFDERQYSIEQRTKLENVTMKNFKLLGEALFEKTDQLKLNLESQLSEVATGLKSDIIDVKKNTETTLYSITKDVEEITEKSSELENKLSEIDVESSDFSAIINDVVKAVVSVKTDVGQGSGVIYSEDGKLLTNKHVIEDASAVSVIDYQGNAYAVSLGGYANNADIAILKIDSNKKFNYLRFASDADVGERVIAVGNPLGLSFSVSEGIISALDRKIDDSGIGYIQTDVSINPGNSGGPLVNSQKRIVGLNTLKIKDSEGIGFAIPYDLIEKFADQI